ncbi:hypothetical protein N7460_006711 [Penicillium canescens]|uniref:Uncharacterized protein n=1 Tax=Penicillium canescens TaxID=5083 RepID=A0AAD6IBB2_PENCN|nr:hypothetical protein N7460_006711 [Penicillium canescens]KAJ6065900.1 hypothetical protein N7444_001553 [Penicillium canescens]
MTTAAAALHHTGALLFMDQSMESTIIESHGWEGGRISTSALLRRERPAGNSASSTLSYPPPSSRAVSRLLAASEEE